MTLLSSSSDDTALPLVQPRMVTTMRYLIESLTTASEATKLAVDIAREAPSRITAATAEQSELLAGWRANALLVHEVFDNLYYEVGHAVDTIRLTFGLE